MQRAAIVVKYLLSASLPEAKSSSYSNLKCLLPDACRPSINMNVESWVHAAIDTNLSNFSLFKKSEKSEVVDSDKCHYVILETNREKSNSENQWPQNKPNSRNHRSDSSAKWVSSPSTRHLSSTKKMNAKREDCPKGGGLKETASLAEKLLMVSREWFLGYMEDSLNVRFGLCTGENSETACLLRQLKRVNQWLDDLGGSEVKVDGRIEDLKKKLYGFLLEHVDSAVVAGK